MMTLARSRILAREAYSALTSRSPEAKTPQTDETMPRGTCHQPQARIRAVDLSPAARLAVLNKLDPTPCPVGCSNAAPPHAGVGGEVRMAVQFQFIDYATPMGANLVADGAAFRTWAPRARNVYLVTGDGLKLSAAPGWTPGEDCRLTPLGDGTWAGFVAGAGDGLEYLFWIEGEASRGPKRDPYARELTLTPAFPASYCILRDPSTYPWHDAVWKPPDYSKLIIYQLHIGTWWAVDAAGADVRGARSGRFLDVAQRLGYLRELGINAIQLLPVQEFPTEFSEGYNGVDYFSPEQDYQAGEADIAWLQGKVNATLVGFGERPLTIDQLRPGANQLKCLIDLAHLHGIAVVFDLVYNHAGGGFDPQSLWFYDRFPNGDQNNSLYFTDQAGRADWC